MKTKAGVKLTNIVGPKVETLKVKQTKVEPFDIPSQLCGNVSDQHDHTKGPVKLMQWVKIAPSFLQSVSNGFHFTILSLPMQFYI